MESLDGRVAFITGTTRGIGKELALSLADEGCTIISTGKTSAPKDDLPGTIYRTADEVRERGANAMAIKLDIRDETAVQEAVGEVIAEFGQIDFLINNAGAIDMHPVTETPPERFDLLMDVNARGAYTCSHAVLPHMLERGYGHILMSSPPIKADSAPGKAAYALSKVGMTFIAKSLAEEMRGEGVGVNSIWPVTAIDSQATRHFGLGTEADWRSPQIVADAVKEILSRDPDECTGNAFYDEEVLREAGVTDFSPYSVVEGASPPPLSAQFFDPDYGQ
ncbi:MULTISPECIES: SDR family oxidoreductase [unclassified Haladaptatus]|uniref:SDR family oxidoreductase n=1 Tax=unclassified Haladaptatus TaxID=2622732 RepID=UPI0023E7E667|nr:MULTISPECIES: SDR family oxidoreductase [unclassified Haladaptatus]